MKILVAAITLGFAASWPAIAPGQQAHAQTYGQYQAASKKPAKVKKVKAPKRAVLRSASPYSTNPAHDVYVNGQYVGSDPDPRIRATLRHEYCSETLDGC